MTAFHSRTLIIALTAFAAVACKGDKGAQPSYCESMCELAVECAVAQRDVDADALMAECIAATEAAGQCGELNVAEEKLAKPCIESLEERKANGECDAFTGSSDEVALDLGPADCLTQGGFGDAWDAAQQTTSESGAEMCERFTSTFCDKITECVNSSAGYDPATFETTPYDVCMTSMQGRIDECATDGRYDVDGNVNIRRDAVNDCLSDVGGELTCDQLFAGDLPATCAGAFIDPDQAFAYGSGLAEVGASFASGR